MSKVICYLVVLVSFFATLVMGQNRGVANSGIGSSLHAEAQQKAKNFWLSKLSLCNGIYFARSKTSNNLIEFKDGTISVETGNVSQVDSLNGIQFRGVIRFKTSASREFQVRTGVWSPWTADKGIISYSNNIVKANGNWSIDDGSGYLKSSWTEKISCNEALQPHLYKRQVDNQILTDELVDAESKGLFVSQTKATPIEMFRKIYSPAKNGYSARVNLVSDFSFMSENDWIVVGEMGHVIWGSQGSDGRGLWSNNLPNGLRSVLVEFTSNKSAYFYFMRSAFADDGRGVAIYSRERRDTRFWSQNVPEEMYLELTNTQNKGDLNRITNLMFAPNGGWAIIYTDGKYIFQGLPDEMGNLIVELSKKGHTIKYIHHDRNFWAIIWLDGTTQRIYGKLPSDLVTDISDERFPRSIDKIAISPNGGWIIKVCTGLYTCPNSKPVFTQPVTNGDSVLNDSRPTLRKRITPDLGSDDGIDLSEFKVEDRETAELVKRKLNEMGFDVEQISAFRAAPARIRFSIVATKAGLSRQEVHDKLKEVVISTAKAKSLYPYLCYGVWATLRDGRRILACQSNN